MVCPAPRPSAVRDMHGPRPSPGPCPVVQSRVVLIEVVGDRPHMIALASASASALALAAALALASASAASASAFLGLLLAAPAKGPRPRVIKAESKARVASASSAGTVMSAEIVAPSIESATAEGSTPTVVARTVASASRFASRSPGRSQGDRERGSGVEGRRVREIKGRSHRPPRRRCSRSTGAASPRAVAAPWPRAHAPAPPCCASHPLDHAAPPSTLCAPTVALGLRSSGLMPSPASRWWPEPAPRCAALRLRPAQGSRSSQRPSAPACRDPPHPRGISLQKFVAAVAGELHWTVRRLPWWMPRRAPPAPTRCNREPRRRDAHVQRIAAAPSG